MGAGPAEKTNCVIRGMRVIPAQPPDLQRREGLEHELNHMAKTPVKTLDTKAQRTSR